MPKTNISFTVIVARKFEEATSTLSTDSYNTSKALCFSEGLPSKIYAMLGISSRLTIDSLRMYYQMEWVVDKTLGDMHINNHRETDGVFKVTN